jgi:hypothetical protein
MSTFIVCAIGVVLVLAWVRSYSVSDGLFWKDQRVVLRVVSSRGRVLAGYWRSTGSIDWPKVGLGYSRRLPRDVGEMNLRPEAGVGVERRWERLGVVVQRDGAVSVSGRMVVVPYWVVLAVGAVLVLGKRVVWTSLVRRRRRRRGWCEGCGYDLRGSGERCPECGRGMAAGAAAPQV